MISFVRLVAVVVFVLSLTSVYESAASQRVFWELSLLNLDVWSAMLLVPLSCPNPDVCSMRLTALSLDLVSDVYLVT